MDNNKELINNNKELINNNKKLINRLRRIEGQIKGIEKMIDEGQFCGDVLIQITAAKSALNNVGGIILENYTKECIRKEIENNSSEKSLDELINIILKYAK